MTSLIGKVALVTGSSEGTMTSLIGKVALVTGSSEGTMTSLIGKVAVVTGSSEGIGAAIAGTLVREGVTVVGCARRADKLKESSDSLKGAKGEFFPIQCDLRKDENILSMFRFIKDKFGGLDICINNAGTAKYGSVIDGEIKDLQEMIDVNITALSICTQESIKLFEHKGVDGHIINIGSVSGHVTIQRAREHWYSATKWMVRVLTECLRLELREKKKRTRVSMISPGLTCTDLTLKALGEETGKQILKDNETITPRQVADCVMFALTASDNVEVNDIIVRPTSQKE